MTKVLIITHEPVGTMMTGPAIRCWEIAKVLGRNFDVTLAAPGLNVDTHELFEIAIYQREYPGSLEKTLSGADAVIISGYLLRDFPFLINSNKALIVDIYDPFPVENLNLLQTVPSHERDIHIKDSFKVIDELLRSGDFFICGSEVQRDFWLGMLATAGRLNPATHAVDPTFRKLIDVVSMGIPETPPVTGDRVKGEFPGIDCNDFLVVWPGGVWDWLDPLTAIEAISLLSERAPDVKLFFPGIRHPFPDRVGKMENPDRVLLRAGELGLLNRRVFYRDWTPYDKRESYLLDADVAISLHFNFLESHLAIRTRLLDCLWGGLPVIATSGDVIGEDMAKLGIAITVPPGDATSVAEAIMEWRANKHSREKQTLRLPELAQRYYWTEVCSPLVSYLRKPYRAPDKTQVLSDHEETLDPPSPSNLSTIEPTSITEPVRMEDQVDNCNVQKEEWQIDESTRHVNELSFRVASLEVQMANTLEQLCLKEAELQHAQDLLYRVSQGKIMRLINYVNRVRRIF